MPLEIAPYLQRLRATSPELPLARVAVEAGGQYNVGLLVDDELIVRFPRFAAGIGTLRREAAILDGIRPFVSLPVPRVVYASFDPPEVGQVFAGYHRLPGEPLRRETVARLDDAMRRRVAGQLGTFLRELHRVPFARAIPAPLSLACGMAAPDWWSGWRDLYARIRAAVFPRVAADVRASIAAHFEPFLADDTGPAFTPALIHGDFGTGNILFDAASGTISGIIDFGSAGLGDPACDLAAILTYGEGFADLVLAGYPELAAALLRARIYRGTFAAQEALYGAEHGDADAFARGIAPYAR